MVYIVTNRRFNVQEFCGVFRTQGAAASQIERSGLSSAVIIPVDSIEFGSDKKTLFVAQRYFPPPEDLFGYAGVFEDFETAMRHSGNMAAGVLTWEL